MRLPHWRILPRTAAALVAACACSASLAVTFTEVKAEWQPSDTVLLDRNGELLQRLRTDKTVRKGPWVALADVSPALRTAMVLSEDKRFYEHSGVDWQAVSAAAWANLWNRKTRGASTITMQLAGLLDDDLKRGATGRSLSQKMGQAVSAQVLERGWRKDQILEAYLNLVPFRGELVGIEALSQTLFGKAPHGLDQREAAVAAALVRAPNAKAGQVTQRACGVLQALQTGSPGADCNGLDLFVDAALQRRDYAPSEGIAPHLARRLAQPMAPGNVIRTTLSAPLQRFASQTLQQHLRELRGRNVEDGAIVVLDNATGGVLAWVGSSGPLSSAADVDGVTALRQPGSTLKPFLYAQAIAERRLTAASLLEDAGTQIQTSGGLYIPQNYDRQFKGWISVRTGLGASLNVPAVRTLVMVSPNAFQQQLNRLGLGLKQTGDYYGFSLALGSAEVSLLNLANAYRALGNGGRYGPTTLLQGQATINRTVVRAGTATPGTSASGAASPVQALDARAAFIVGDILSDANARTRTFGTDSILSPRFWTAVKTGTSKDMRDNWAMGFSERYTVGVWMGNASGAPMWDVSGTTGAAPIWAAVMGYLHKTLPSHAPRPPTGLVHAKVSFEPFAGQTYGDSAQEASRMEWFIDGTQQERFSIHKDLGGTKPATGTASAAALPGRITAPANGTIVALDPDIPPQNQRLTFVAQGAGTRWLMNGKPFAQGPQAHWLPWPGRHTVQLVSAKGETLDQIQIEVRGAGVVKNARAPR